MKNLTLGLLVLLSIILFSCEVEDGVDGIDGVNGENGINGENGNDGENGEGFELLTKFGGIDVNISGTRLDGVEIDAETFEFIYSDFDADALAFDNSIEMVEVDNVTNFRVERKLDPEHSSEMDLEFTLDNETQEVTITSVELDDFNCTQ